MAMIDRQRLVTDALESKRLDALLVTHLPNVRYLTGFTGSSGVLLVSAGKQKPIFITDGRYTSQAHEQVQGAKVMISKGPALDAAAQQIVRLKLTNVGIESDHMAV